MPSAANPINMQNKIVVMMRFAFDETVAIVVRSKLPEKPQQTPIAFFKCEMSLMVMFLSVFEIKYRAAQRQKKVQPK